MSILKSPNRMLIVNSFNKKKFLKFTVITRIWNVVWRGVEGKDLEERRLWRKEDCGRNHAEVDGQSCKYERGGGEEGEAGR